METKDQRLIEAALGANDYRSFLRNVFTAMAKDGKPNYSAIARRAGFSSRGFVPEVIDGRRRLTGNSFPKMLRAVGGTVLLRGYFTSLVQLEEPELNPESLSEAQLRTKLKEQRQKLKSRLSASDRSSVATTLCKSHHILMVFASLGGEQTGASLETIARRTGLDLAVCKSVLDHLLDQGVAVERDGGYHSADPMMIFEGLSQEHGFQASYLETLGELKRKATAKFNSPDQLFCQSYFSVDRRRLPELKKRMLALVQEFVETNESEGGDSVARLIVGLYS